MFLSIIIPCYNAKAYIGKCLNSIWDEGLLEDEYEVICIDDCSTDDTLLHLYELQKLHNNMQVLRNCENLRAGGARNHGVKNSCGKYILFIDADDYIDLYTCEKAYQRILQEAQCTSYSPQNIQSYAPYPLQDSLPDIVFFVIRFEPRNF